MTTTRRKFLQRTTAGLALAGCPAIIRQAAAADSIAFTTPFGYDPTFIDIMNAKSGGHFAKEGLDVKVIGPPGTAESFQLMLSGQAQFALVGGIDFIRAVGAKGAPFRSVSTIGQGSGFHMVSLAEKPVKTGADLRGKTVGVLSIGGLTENLVRIMATRAGLTNDDVRVISAGSSPGEVELIRQGRLDCFICNFPATFALQHSGQKLEILNLDKVVPSPGQIYYTTNDIVAKKPDLVKRVLRAMYASVTEIIAGPIAPIFTRAGKDFEIPRSKDVNALAALMTAMISENWLSQGKENLMRNVPSLWQSGCDALRQVKIADVKDPTTLYTNSFIDKIVKA